MYQQGGWEMRFFRRNGVVAVARILPGLCRWVYAVHQLMGWIGLSERGQAEGIHRLTQIQRMHEAGIIFFCRCPLGSHVGTSTEGVIL